MILYRLSYRFPEVADWTHEYYYDIHDVRIAMQKLQDIGFLVKCEVYTYKETLY